MPLQSKANNNSLFFRVNQRTSTIISHIRELQDELNIDITYLSELNAAIDLDNQVINQSNQRTSKLNEAILSILKLKFIIAALQKIELPDPVFAQAFTNDKDVYQKIVKVARDKNERHKKTRDFVCNELKHLKSQIIIDDARPEPDTTEACDVILAKLNYFKVLEKEITSKFEKHIVAMQENIRLKEIKIYALKSSIKTLEIEYNFQTFFEDYNTKKHELNMDKLSVRNTIS